MSVARFPGWSKCSTEGCEAAAIMPVPGATLCLECYTRREVQMPRPALPKMPPGRTLEEILQQLTADA